MAGVSDCGFVALTGGSVRLGELSDKCPECGQVMVVVYGGAACRACRTGEERLIDYTQVAIMYPVGKN